MIVRVRFGKPILSNWHERRIELRTTKAIAILKDMLEKPTFSAEEKEAVMTSIGMLSWGALGASRLKARKAKRDKDAAW